MLTAQREGAETKGVIPAHVEALREAFAAGKIRNLMSVMQLQEAAHALNAPSAEVAQEELDIIRDLLYQDEVIKFPSDLLFENIVNFAYGVGPAYPLTPNTLDLDGLFSPSGDIEERKQALTDTRAKESEFLDVGMKGNDREIILAEFGGARPTFEAFYEATIIRRLRELVKSVERHSGRQGILSACEKRGIEGMLEFRTLAIAGGTNLSYQYARVFRDFSEKKKRRGGDPPDLTHALLSSAAEILVTHDGDFAFWFGRAPHKGVEVLDHLRQLLERVD